jgi:hypothetical protein
MGPRLMNRPPKFVHGFIDRHGRPRFYFRRAGFKMVPLPGLPWSPEFMATYEAAIAERPLEIGASRTKPGTMRALAVAYYNSGEFRNLRPASQSTYRQVIRSPSAANHFKRALRALMRHAVDTVVSILPFRPSVQRVASCPSKHRTSRPPSISSPNVTP